jgi:hypothetical protein
MMELPGPKNQVKRRKLHLKQQQTLLVYGEQDFLDVEARIKSAYDELCVFSKPIIERGFGGSAKVDWIPARPQP